jgi:hypothetical protein
MFLGFLSLAAAASAAPVTRDQLMAMARGKVDPAVMRAIVERDCVDFEVNAGNAAELSRAVPASVLEAAIACRRRVMPTPATAAPAPPAGASPALPAGASPAPPVAAPVPPPPAPVVASTPSSAGASPAAAAPASSPAPSAPPPGAPSGPSKIRLRAVFIGESGALRCSASIDGVEAATFLKEEEGKFGEAVARDRIGRETGYLPVSPGTHHVVFRCDPKDQSVAVDVDIPAGESRTIEIGETTLRNWKLKRIQTP